MISAGARSGPASIAAGIGRRLRAFWLGLSAVCARELRGRMRGKRAFAVVTVYLLLLCAIAFGIYADLRQQAAIASSFAGNGFRGPVPLPGMGAAGVVPAYALSASIGHAIYGGLLLVETLMVLVLAPAFTSGAISLEREKQTMDMLVATPLSTLGMVVGKLFSSLTYVLLLILASVPVMAAVFVFGGVAPDDLLRAYLLLFAVAFGMGAVGLFISALVRRTQTATVVTFVVVLALTLGTAAAHELWDVLSTRTTEPQPGIVLITHADRAPVALLWLNPFVGDLDLICTTAPGGYDTQTCGYIASVTGTPFFGLETQAGCAFGLPCPWPPDVMAKGGLPVNVRLPAAPVVVGFAADDVAPDTVLLNGQDQAGGQPVGSFGFPRDTFWPQSALAFLVLGVVLTLLSAQLVAPTRRMRLPRWRRHRLAPPAPPAPPAELGA